MQIDGIPAETQQQLAAAASAMLAAGASQQEVDDWVISRLPNSQNLNNVPVPDVGGGAAGSGGGSPFVSRTPEEQAAATTLAQERAKLSVLPDQQRIEVQGAADKAAAEARAKGQVEREFAEPARQEKVRQIATKIDAATAAVDKAMGQIDWTTAGFVGSRLSNVPGTAAYDLRATANTIKANLAFDTLQQMREASPTGGALGAVSERELALLESAVASIDQAQSPGQLRDALNAVKTHYANWREAVTNADRTARERTTAAPAAQAKVRRWNPASGRARIMPIQVQLPDGTIGEFPDGMSDAQIEAVLRREFPAPKADFAGVSAKTDTTARGPGRTDTGIADLIRGKRREPTLLQRAGRELGLGARSMIQGTYGLAGMLGGDIAGAAEHKARGLPYRSTRDTGVEVANWLGLPTPQTGMERIGGDITESVTGSGGLMGLGRMALAKGGGAIMQGVGNFLAGTPRLQLASAVGSAGPGGLAREAGAGPGGQMAAAIAGGLAPTFGRAALQGAARGVVRGGEAGRAQMAGNIEDFNALGAQPSVGQAAGNWRMRGIENLLAGGPTSGGVMARAAERQADDIGAGLRQMADDFLPNASAERAGRAVEKGVDTFAKNVGAVRKALYWQADKLIPDTTALPLSRTQVALAELTTPTQGATATTGGLINPRIAQIAQNVTDDLAANSGVMPYAAVKELRSRIGEELSDFALSADRPTAQYKRLYAALSQDLEEAARAQGPAASQAIKRANNYFKASAERLTQLERVVDKAGGPEAVYNAVMSGTRDGGTTLRAVMQSLPQEGQQALTGAVIKRMGLATPGQQDAAGEAFSAATFLTNWNRVSPEARRALFDRHGPQFAENMDKIARVAANIREGSRVFANPSGTANKAAAYTYLGALAGLSAHGNFGSVGAALAGGVGANISARVLTNPKVVAWLARSTELPVSTIPTQIAALQAYADRADDEDAAEFAQLLKENVVQDEGNRSNNGN